MIFLHAFHTKTQPTALSVIIIIIIIEGTERYNIYTIEREKTLMVAIAQTDAYDGILAPMMTRIIR